jgi:anaerobic selenocysteine-containing dehydrogenase
MAKPNTSVIKEDKWIHTTCGACYACCPIKVHIINGIPVKIEGEPEASTSKGSVCAKTQGAMTIVNDPNRINKPLKRTNPKKGLNEDPGWVEISWEEAYDIITTKLKEIYNTDGRQFKANTMPSQGCYCQPHIWSFSQALGSPNQSSGAGGMLCGNAAHFVAGLTHGSWSHTADLKYCNYVLQFGASKGHAAGHSSNQMMRSMADARSRGMKQIVIDPICNFVGGKATRWVPIIPGTDIAVILAMVNIMLNELNIWDDVFIKKLTNGPYLIGPDKHYIRDPKTQKPLIWDAVDKKAKTWDDPTVKEFAIMGTYDVNGVKGTPGFNLLREHVKTYTPEYASKLSSVPVDVIRTIATEFATEAKIGSTIQIEGKSYPLRPVAAIGFSGLNNHRNAFNSVAGVHMLNMIVGAMDVPGGCLGWPTRCFGYKETGRPYYEPTIDPVEGMLLAGWWWGETQRGERLAHTMWPVQMSTTPEDSLGLRKLFTWSNDSPFFFSKDRDEAHKKIGPDYEAKAWMNFGNNMIMSSGNLDNMDDTLKNIPFFFTFDVYLTEITYYADVVLPDTSFLESLCVNQNLQTGFNGPVGMNDWSFHIRQPAVEPSGERRGLTRVLLELARRMGPQFYADYLQNLNRFFGLEGKNKLDTAKEYTLEQVSDNILKNFFGDQHDLKWFKENGGLHWPKKADEAYWRYEVPARAPLYWEFVLRMGESAKAIAEPRDFHMQWEQYTALPTFFETMAHQEKNPEFDLYTLIYRDTLHTGSNTQMHPELDALSKMNPYSYYININEETGKKKGLKNGQMIWVETATGRKIKGPVSFIKGIHPDMLAVAGISGHWSKYLTIGRGEGVFFNDLLEIDKDHVDPVSLSADSCLKVKIYPAKKEEKNA